jgi:prolyl-tRNA synthetase
MRLSQFFIVTLRDDPADAEVPSHRLLARGGFIYKIAAGLYAYSPLMWRTLQKVSQIVRDEITKGDGLEVCMPMAQPKELWVSSGRWDRYVNDGIMFSLKDRKQAELCLGPTHEEVMTAYVKASVTSYKQLPINLFQIGDKFRDEIRPRFGLMRGREFIMMDAYSFDTDQKGLDVAYDKMAAAYRRVFERCGLNYTVVDADAGAIGGSGSQEFHVVADTGEDALIHCKGCGYSANVEKAESRLVPAPAQGDPQALTKHATPNVKTVEQLVAFFPGWQQARMAKTVLYKATFADREEIVAAMARGDHEINEVKLGNALNCLALKLATEDEIKKATGADVGFAGPVGLNDKVRLLADVSLKDQANLLTGCNETGYHCLNVNLGRDCRMPAFHDFRLVHVGEACPRCGHDLAGARGIEVGHIFKLGTKYSTAMSATFTDQDGKSKPFVMGCYGIGVSRTAASAVEQNHDERGIIWPAPIAPFEVVIAVMDLKKDEQMQLAQTICSDLRTKGVDAAIDDRDLRPGAKFKDLELLGFPVQIVVGRRASEGVVEFGLRRDSGRVEMPVGEAQAKALAAIGRS